MVLLADKKFHKANIEIMKGILINNCFPDKLIDKYMGRKLREEQW